MSMNEEPPERRRSMRIVNLLPAAGSLADPIKGGLANDIGPTGLLALSNSLLQPRNDDRHLRIN
jgi:hypothetical protein